MAEASVGDDNLVEVEGDTSMRHGLCDELVDPWCELCLENSKPKVDAIFYCPECNICLCRSCNEFHKTIPVSENHRVLRGPRMPKSIADKPVKYPDCKTHTGKSSDHYCFQHHKLVCKHCIEHNHKGCIYQAVSDVCKNLESEDIHHFKDVLEEMKKNVFVIKSATEKNVSDLECQKRRLIEDAARERDKIISKAKELYEGTVSNITEIALKSKSQLADHISMLSDEIHSLDEIMLNIDKKVCSKFNQNAFIQMQHIVARAQDCAKEIEGISDKIHKIELSFTVRKEISEILDKSKRLGNIQQVFTATGRVGYFGDVSFPISSSTMARKPGDAQREDISQISMKKLSSWNVRVPGEKMRSTEIYLAVTGKNRVLLSDKANKAVKYFSNDGTFLSSVTLSNGCLGITQVTARTAAVNTCDQTLHILDISDPSTISVHKSISLGYWVAGLTLYDNKLVVTALHARRSVKMIDINGQEIWSISTGPDGQHLFEKPYGVVVNTINDTDTVIVSDRGKDSLILLNACNGQLMNVVDLTGKYPHGITVDEYGNTIVCYRQTREICIWSNDFTQSRILLMDRDLRIQPKNITYSSTSGEFFVSYNGTDEIDRFQLSIQDTN